MSDPNRPNEDESKSLLSQKKGDILSVSENETVDLHHEFGVSSTTAGGTTSGDSEQTSGQQTSGAEQTSGEQTGLEQTHPESARIETDALAQTDVMQKSYLV
jgi:hypothetical protein